MTKSNVVPLFPEGTHHVDPKEIVWRCGCGSETFFFYWDGELECTECHTMQDGHDEFLVD